MPNNIPKVSIMIPVYNREKIIRDTLDCAVNQNYNENFEIVVIDNCSTDNTYKILEEYSEKYLNIKIYKNEENLGPVRNWQKGIEKCSGQYIKILWSDDQISLDFLDKTVKILEENPDVGFVYTKTEIYVDGEEKKNIVYKFGKSGKYSNRELLEAHLFGKKSVPVSPGCAIFRAEDIKQNLEIEIENPKKLIFSRYGAGNDLLLFLRTYPKYENFYYLDEVKSFFRAHKDSFSIANPLDEYYTFSKFYYVENYLKDLDFKNDFSKLKNKFYSKLLLSSKYRYMVKESNFSFEPYIFIELGMKILRRIIGKIKRLIFT